MTVGLPHMKHTIDEDPVTHEFAVLRLPNTFVDGDKLPICATDQWFRSREEAVAAGPKVRRAREARTSGTRR